ncbi:hypothetical protein, partial [Streptococcus pneumoniae]|uniref:hypothetical protein n=1 Tax=Streptococcus pneumoniae TaxID=1313 RepID=UPI0013DA7229
VQALFAVLADPVDEPAPPRRRSVPCIGLPTSWLAGVPPVDRATGLAFSRAVDRFRDLGAVVREVALPPLGDYHAACFAILM